MERKDRKRKALEPLFVSEKITELSTELRTNDALLREEIHELHNEINNLKKQVETKSEEAARFQAEAEFLHPDAVVDRVRIKLWHHGDLSLLRRAIDPRTRVLRNTENRSDRTLYICDTPPKKGGSKAHLANRSIEMLPKQESEEATVMEPTMDQVNHLVSALEEKEYEEAANGVHVEPVAKEKSPVQAGPQQNDAEGEALPQQNDGLGKSLPQQNDVEGEALPQQNDGQDKSLPQQNDAQDKSLLHNHGTHDVLMLCSE